MKILVTGSSDTIGTRLAETLLGLGHDIIGLDWRSNEWNSEIEGRTVHIDLRKEELLKSITEIPEMIVHLAANARVYELVEHPDRARDNFLTLFNILEFARTQGVKKFFFASSREGYGNIPASAFTEDLVRVEHCESPYTASKVGGEALIEAYRRCYGIDTITFRFSNVYGMYDSSVRAVPLFIRLARKNEPITVFGREKCLDFTYIDDAVAGVVAAIDRFAVAKNRTYNIATGEGTEILRLAERIKELLGSSSKITIGAPRTGEVIRFVADITRAREILGYEPKTMFEDGIRKTVEWYGKHMP